MVRPIYHGSFHASVLMGSFDDHRSDGPQAHGMLSKSLSGAGKSAIEINMVEGSLDAKAWD